jgi:argininosuccinate lyase
MRSAHEAVGNLVRECEKQKCRLVDLPDAMFDVALGEPGASATGGIKAALGVKNAIDAFQSYGSTAPAEVESQLREWKERLS